MREKYQRTSLRLPTFDYADSGYYFVTICTHNRERLFGKIICHQPELNRCGFVTKREIQITSKIRKNVSIDSFVVMPDHVHIVFRINHGDAPIFTGTPPACPYEPRRFGRSISGTISSVIAQIKSIITKRLMRLGCHHPVWQRNYYERIIRDERELFNVRMYIRNNPKKYKTITSINSRTHILTRHENHGTIFSLFDKR